MTFLLSGFPGEEELGFPFEFWFLGASFEFRVRDPSENRRKSDPLGPVKVQREEEEEEEERLYSRSKTHKVWRETCEHGKSTVASRRAGCARRLERGLLSVEELDCGALRRHRQRERANYGRP
jgi:hypothetical protein